MPWPPLAPVFLPGKEPLPPGMTEEDRAQLMQAKKYQDLISIVPETCVFKTGMAGVAGFGLGAFFSLMSSSFAYEDPLLRSQAQVNATTTQKARDIFKDMGKGMWRSGKGFGKVGALFAGLECAIESYRAKNDMVNPVVAGFIAGGILARNSGPKAALGGGAAFAAFSAAIDLFLKRESSECVDCYFFLVIQADHSVLSPAMTIDAISPIDYPALIYSSM
ncbi:TIM22 [Sanghuangporus weigelae]